MSSERFEDLMSAISFAEEGEHEKAREFLKGRDTLLLAVSDMVFDKNIFRYAMNLSRRIKAGIDILYLTKVEANGQYLREFIAEAVKEGIRCSLVRRDGCMKKAILDYTDKKREIMFVVVGSTPELDIECKTGEKSLSDAWRRLKCPLVVVSKGDLPSTA